MGLLTEGKSLAYVKTESIRIRKICVYSQFAHDKLRLGNTQNGSEPVVARFLSDHQDKTWIFSISLTATSLLSTVLKISKHSHLYSKLFYVHNQATKQLLWNSDISRFKLRT